MRSDDMAVVNFAIPCGIEDAQYFGEMFKDYQPVESPCSCKQMCLDHVDEGCASWKWSGGCAGSASWTRAVLH